MSNLQCTGCNTCEGKDGKKNYIEDKKCVNFWHGKRNSGFGVFPKTFCPR